MIATRDKWTIAGAAALVVVGRLVWIAHNRNRVLSLSELVELARRHGFPDPNVAAAVAMAESGGKVGIWGDQTLGGSYGLWQIHHPSHPEYSFAELVDADGNARAALAISQRGANWSPWSTYRSGAYRRYLGGA